MSFIENIKEKYNGLSLPLKASIWFLICNLLLKGISFISTPIFTRVLPPSEYGLLATFMTYQDLILTLSTWQIALSAYQKGIYKFKYDLKFFSGVVQIFSNLLTIVFFLLVFVFFQYFSSYTGMDFLSAVCLCLYMLLEPSFSCWLIHSRSNYKYKNAVIMTFLQSVLTVIIPLYVVVNIDCSAVARFRSSLFISCILYSYFYVKQLYIKQICQNIKRGIRYCKYIISYQVPIVIHAISYTVLAQADRLMIGSMVGNEEVAYYTIAYNIGAIALIVQTSISQALIPWRFEKLQNRAYGDIFKYTRIIVAAMGGLILSFILISPEVVKMMFTENYYEAVWSIPPVSVGMFFVFLYSMFVWVENYYEKTSYVALVSVVCSFINVILNYVSIPFFGYIACGYTTAISYMCFGLGHYYFMKKACKASGVYEDIYDIRSFLFISVVVVLLSLVITSLYPYIWIRYMLVTFLLIVVYIRKKDIISVCKFFREK